MHRRTLAAAGAALLARPALAHAPAPADDVLRVVAPFEITGTDPARAGHIFARMGVTETLVAPGAGDGLRPALATGWARAEDGLLWRFRLREGVRFHDGAPMTAEAVAGALDRARAGATPLSRAPIAAVEADGGEVLLRLHRPFTPLPAFLANAGSAVLAPAAYDASGAVRAVIGTGPYRVDRFLPPLQLDTVRFDGWWGPRPAIARASYLVVSQGEARASMAEGGRAGLTMALQPVTVARLRRSPRVEVRMVPVPRTRLLKLNAGSPLFSDARVRRALSLAIDRDGIAAALLRNPAVATDQLFPATLPDWHDPAPTPPRDLGRARALLAEAGWRPGADGVLVGAEGRRFRAVCTTFINWPELPPIATALQAQFREVGVEMVVNVGNSSDIPRTHRDGTLEMALIARNLILVPDPLGVLLQDYGPRGGEWGAMGWSSPAMDGALARLAAGDAEAPALRRRVTAILREELPVIPIAWADLGVAVSRDLTGVAVDPYETTYGIDAIGRADR